MGMRKRPSTKSPPILSHEFFIQNHADIVACVAMVFVFGLMFQVSAPFSSMFMALHHNLSTDHNVAEVGPTPLLYTYGLKDLCAIFFYFLICIVMHAIIQEYALDKINRKLHLSKVKHNKFNESGQLLTFYLVSVLWGGDVIFREKYLMHLGLLWEDYPHHQMTFMFKFFFIVQIAYWLHVFPELYFQKVKKEDMKPRIIYGTLYLVTLTAAYLLNFTRVAICLIVLHYAIECIFHLSRLLYFADKTQAANVGFMLWNGLFVCVRLASITLSVLTFWYGLPLSNLEGIDLSTGNFNIQTIRFNCLLAVCGIQAWMMFNFITFHLKRWREHSANRKRGRRDRKVKRDDGKTKLNSEEDISALPEVDQNAEMRAGKDSRLLPAKLKQRIAVAPTKRK